MFGFLALITVGGGLLYIATSGGNESTDRDEGPQIPTPAPDPLGDAFPQPDPVAEEPLPNVIQAETAEHFAEARDVIEGREGEPRTLYLGTSPDWARGSRTLRRVLELAEDKPELRVLLFDFETTRSLFGLPDSYLAFAATATDPDGRPFAEVFTADRPDAPALETARLNRLVRYADEGAPEQVPPNRGPVTLSS